MFTSQFRTAIRRGFAVLVLAVLFVFAVTPAAAQPPIDRFVDACGEGSSNPFLVTSCFVKGTTAEGDPAIVAYRDTGDNSEHFSLATAGQVGSIYGLAYDGRAERLYAAAYHKRGVPFGPAGPGGIYTIDLRSGDISTFLSVPNAGADLHDPDGDFFPDLPARFAAGRTGLGDLDLKHDGSELAVMNLNDRKIYRFSVPGGEALGSFDHGAAGADWSADARPFGLKYREGKLYHGVVRTAESSQNRDELWAYVFESAPDGSGMREVASTPLNYERGFYWPNEGRAVWNPWIDPPGQVVPNRGRYAMPMLADLEFAHDGSQMILGFRDRFGDMTFYTRPPQVPPPGENIYNVAAGDIVAAFPDGDRWRVQVDPEYYSGDFGSRPSGEHDETSFGGLAMIPGNDIVSMSANSPERVNSAGAVWLSVGGGNDTGREEIYVFGDAENNFGKANGLGDVEVICDTLDQVTPTPVPSDTPPSTSTAQPSATPQPSNTPVPSPTVTLPPGVTPPPPSTAEPPDDDEPDDDVEAPPEVTVELPKLPKTGSGGDAGAMRNLGAMDADGPASNRHAAWIAILALFGAWAMWSGVRR